MIKCAKNTIFLFRPQWTNVTNSIVTYIIDKLFSLLQVITRLGDGRKTQWLSTIQIPLIGYQITNTFFLFLNVINNKTKHSWSNPSAYSQKIVEGLGLTGPWRLHANQYTTYAIGKLSSACVVSMNIICHRSRIGGHIFFVFVSHMSWLWTSFYFILDVIVVDDSRFWKEKKKCKNPLHSIISHSSGICLLSE